MPPARGPEGGGPEAVDVSGPLARYLAGLPPRRVRVVRLALRAFEWSPFPWRFSRASLEARQDFLRRMDESGSWIRQDLLLAPEDPDRYRLRERPTRQRRGWRNGDLPRGSRASPRPHRPRTRSGGADGWYSGSDAPWGLDPLGDGEDCDFAVVGSGAGGAVAATVLAEAGHDVLVLEAGPYLDRRTYPDEPLAALSTLYRDGGLTVAEGLPAIPTPVGRAVGGTTVINSGTCFRAPDEVLERWRSESGIDWITDLDAEYAEAEEMLHVQPVDPERMGRNGQLLREGAEALGVSHHPLARNAGACVNCGSCPYGCRLDAKRAMHVSYLPRAVAAGARVRSGVEARRLSFEGQRATGIDCVAGVARREGSAPRPFRVNARRGVIVAGGAFGTPELLMRSGVGSPSGELGGNLRIHPACWVGARFEDEVRGWEGIMQSYAVDEWQRDGLLLEATFTPLAFGGHWMPGTGAEHQERLASYGHVASTGVHLSDRSRGRVGLAGDGSLRITYRLTREDTRRLSFGIARAAELFYAAGAREVYPQLAGVPVLPRNRITDLDSRRRRRDGCAWRRSTRSARPGWTPIQASAWSIPRGLSTAVTASTWRMAACSRARSA